VCQGVCKTLASACEVRYVADDKAVGGTAKVASLFSLMAPNAPLGPRIPAMEHRVFSAVTIAVVAVVALLVVMYGLDAVFMLIASYGD
jgi:hypothetical protein